MKNPFNAIRRCEELTYENAKLRDDIIQLRCTIAAKDKKLDDLTEKADHLRKIVNEGGDPEKDELIKKQDESIGKLLAQLQASEQGRERAVRKLFAANKENKQLLHVNAKLADCLRRPAFKSNLKEQEDGQ